MNLIKEFAAWFFGRIGDAISPPKPTLAIQLNPPRPMRKLPKRIIDIASKEVGIVETSRNQGPGIEKYWAATSYPTGYQNREPYCAAAVCWIVQQAMGDDKWTFRPPRSATAFGFEHWSLAQDESTQTKRKPRGDISPGDLVIFNFSHIGIATSTPNKNGIFSTIEANTGPNGERDGDGVWNKRRHIDLVRSRIRFTV